MKKIQLSVLAFLTSSSFMMAGGDILNITPYEVEDIQSAEVVEIITPPAPPVEVVVTPPVTIPPVVVPAIVVPTASVSPFYVGLGLVAARYETSCNCGPASGTDKTGGVVAKVGYDFNEYMGIEARGLVTSYKADGGKIKHVGVFVKPMVPVTDALNAYGLVGLAKTTTTGSLQRTNVSGLAFGAGLEYDLSTDTKKEAKYDREFDGKADQEKGFGVFADYERLYYKSGSPDLDAVSVGVTYDF